VKALNGRVPTHERWNDVTRMTKTTWTARGWRLTWQLVCTLVEVAIALLVLTVGEGRFQQVSLGA